MIIRPFFLFVFLAFGVQTLLSQFPFRTWTSSSGVKIQARLISFTGNNLTIERSDSKQFVFPLTLLSKEDQEYVKNLKSGNSSYQSASNNQNLLLSPKATSMELIHYYIYGVQLLLVHGGMSINQNNWIMFQQNYFPI